MVEPQDLGRQEQALMLEGKDVALCHPGCVHQPVTPLEAPSHILPTGTTHPTWHTPPLLSGAKGKDCTSCPGNGGPFITTSNLRRCRQWHVGGGYLRKNGHRPD